MNNISFKGINISNSNVLGYKMRIYKLTEKDAPFINELKNNINLQKLYPGIKKDDFEIYNDILQRGLKASISKNKSSLLLTCNNIPCGILVNSEKNSKHFVDYICTWPIESNKKAPFGAQTLFLQMFKDFLLTNSNFIELNATRFGNAISKYLKLGFKPCGGDNYTEIMKIKRSDIEKSLNLLQNKINLQPTLNNTELDLSKILNINY